MLRTRTAFAHPRTPSQPTLPWTATHASRSVSTKCGIVGLPNVGKSTLFNALTASQRAKAANYPFCTIDPNVGAVPIYDQRLEKLAKVEGSQKVVQAEMEFIDIAGLIRGASKGEGLGNKFLSHIRGVDVVAFVLRCFLNENIQHVENKVDPVADMNTLNTELILADMDMIDKKKKTLNKLTSDKKALYIDVIDKASAILEKEQPLRCVEWSKEEVPVIKDLQLLTSKRALFICNTDESGGDQSLVQAVREVVASTSQSAQVVEVCASLESEVAQVEDLEERKQLLQEFGVETTGLERVVQAAYNLLDVVTYYTVGEKEARAWKVKRGATAPQAAGVIHTDFERCFIRAETVAFTDFEKHGSMAVARKKGAMRLEGKEYICQDGDIFLFRTSA